MSSYKPAPEEVEKLELLNDFRNALVLWDGGQRTSQNRSWINQNINQVQEIVREAECAVQITIAPPPIVGGMILRDVNPFDLLFNPPYRQSMVPTIMDIIDQTIGAIKSGRLSKKQRSKSITKNESRERVGTSKKVFVVHGHDNEAKLHVARVLEKLNLEPIVLHEQPSKGKTIIEKIEHYSAGLGFAVVILSPDDFGGNARAPEINNPRARQNVILELGYMVAKLGRDRVCALVKDSVEIPSDFDGVVYVTMDLNGAWKFELGRELKAAGFFVDLNQIA
ncbi:MAG: nucleotide-binding protein [Candidatus Didemnitutus sp.]|nr:nucleotide-binding protein [Candidatus Didemnitutus sp.]